MSLTPITLSVDLAVDGDGLSCVVVAVVSRLLHVHCSRPQK